MNKLFINCQQIVLHKTPIRDKETVDLIAASLFGVFISRGSDAVNRLPEILEATNIISDNRSVLEVEHEVLNNYKEDDTLRNAKACVTRIISFRGNAALEKRYMIIPKNNVQNDPIRTIEQITHELIHLLRYEKPVRHNDDLIFQEGVATKKISINDNKTIRKNYMIEESIVQVSTNRAMDCLFKYSNQVTNNSLFSKIDRSKGSYKSRLYNAHANLLNKFMEDDYFRNLVENTFYTYSVDELESYYNSKMNDMEAFTKLSQYFNRLDYFIDEGNTKAAKECVAIILHKYTKFTGSKKYK